MVGTHISMLVMCYLAVFGLHHVDAAGLEKLVRAMDIVKARRFYDYFLDDDNLNGWVRDRWRALYDDEFVARNLWAPAHSTASLIMSELSEPRHDDLNIMEQGKDMQIRPEFSWLSFYPSPSHRLLSRHHHHSRSCLR